MLIIEIILVLLTNNDNNNNNNPGANICPTTSLLFGEFGEVERFVASATSAFFDTVGCWVSGESHADFSASVRVCGRLVGCLDPTANSDRRGQSVQAIGGAIVPGSLLQASLNQSQTSATRSEKKKADKKMRRQDGGAGAAEFAAADRELAAGRAARAGEFLD